jgi:amino acid adenylation domain-containing protein
VARTQPNMPLTVEAQQPVTGEPVVLHEFLERSALQWPDSVALDIPPAPGRADRTTMTYRELAHRSDRVAAAVTDWLDADQGGAIAAILLPRTTAQLYVAQLGVLKAGAAHLCVDPGFSDGQIRHLLSDSDPDVVLTDRSGAELVRRLGYLGPVIRLDRPRGLLTAPSGGPDAHLTRSPERIAYVIYTSGSAGPPRGVLIRHRSAANLIAADLVEFGIGPGDRVAQGSSAACDSSVEEVWMALSAGATVVVMDDATTRSGPDLIGWLREERITVLCPPPTLLRATGCDDPRAALPDLRLVYVGGEVLPEDVAERWAPGRRMVNRYGPVECTVTCLRSDVVPGHRIAIGLPVPGARAWVLDSDLEPVPDGVPGELCVTGIGLAAGYVNQSDGSSTRFHHHPTLGRLYRTGDLAHIDADGAVIYRGRIDSDVKLRGYHVELEAVEACLMRSAGVREAACRVQGDGLTQSLAAHIVPTDPDRPPSFGSLRAALQQRLPAHMVPSLFGLLDRLPRSAGGKVCRADLPTVLARSAARRARVTAPVDPTQQTIAEAVEAVLPPGAVVSIDDDFFDDLGGSSLEAAMVVTRLRAIATTSSITVSDLYRARTVEALARLVGPDPSRPTTPTTPTAPTATPSHGQRGLRRMVWGTIAAIVLAALTGAALLPMYLGRIQCLRRIRRAMSGGVARHQVGLQHDRPARLPGDAGQ